MIRTSSYVIYVDLPDESDYILAVHGYTGAYDRISKEVAAYLRSLETGPPPAPLYGKWSPQPVAEAKARPPSEETKRLLLKRGYLTERSAEEEEDFLGQLASQHHRDQQRKALAFIVMPTYDCNLRCPYCFQDHMRTDPAWRQRLAEMSRPAVDRMCKAWLEIERRHGVSSQRRRNITFFGGEPLLEQLRPLIEYILERAGEMGDFRAHAVTNATDLAAFEDLLGPEGIEKLQITLDGPRAEHDLRRIYPDGRGSIRKDHEEHRLGAQPGGEGHCAPQSGPQQHLADPKNRRRIRFQGLGWARWIQRLCGPDPCREQEDRQEVDDDLMEAREDAD